MTDNVQSLLTDYFTNPASYWGKNLRQPKKIVKGVGNVAATLRMNRRSAISEIIAVGRARSFLAGPTLYISNVGSSGSHWLQAILSSFFPTMDCGETYVPPGIMAAAEGLGAAERRMVMQAILFSNHIRGTSFNKSVYDAPAINTAHIGNQNHYSCHDAPSVRILLVRDPVEVTISRTFRKREYRDHLFPQGITDREYLHVNLEKVLKFYDDAKIGQYDFVIRYENLTGGHDPALGALCERYKANVSDHDIRQALAGEEFRRASSDVRIDTNSYREKRAPIPEGVREYCAEHLSKILQDYGYSAHSGKA